MKFRTRLPASAHHATSEKDQSNIQLRGRISSKSTEGVHEKPETIRWTFTTSCSLSSAAFISQSMADYAKSRQDERRRNFKKAIDGAEARKKREELAVKIRKDKRIESFQKRRHIAADAGEAVSFGTTAAERVCPSPRFPLALTPLSSKNSPTSSTWFVVLTPPSGSRPLAEFASCSPSVRGPTLFRLTLPETSPPIQDVIDAGIVPRLIEFLTMHDHSALQVCLLLLLPFLPLSSFASSSFCYFGSLLEFLVFSSSPTHPSIVRGRLGLDEHCLWCL